MGGWLADRELISNTLIGRNHLISSHFSSLFPHDRGHKSVLKPYIYIYIYINNIHNVCVQITY